MRHRHTGSCHGGQGGGRVRGSGSTGGSGFGRSAGGGGESPQKRVSDTLAGHILVAFMDGGEDGGTPPSPEPRHPKITALMNPYLELTNGKLLLPSILDAGKIRLEDLPGLDKYKNPTTGRNTML